MFGPDHHFQKAPAQPAQDLARVGIVDIEAEERLGQAGALVADQALEQGLLAGEVAVERALRHARRLGDLAHAGAVEPRAEEHPPSSVKDLAPLMVGAAGLADFVVLAF